MFGAVAPQAKGKDVPVTEGSIPSASAHLSSVITPPAPFRLFDLPQEPQDEVFALAYPREEGLRIKFLGDWERG